MHGYGLVHSLGDNLPMTKKQNETTKYATPSDNHTAMENGEENIKRLGGTGTGLLYNMLIPEKKDRLIKMPECSLY